MAVFPASLPTGPDRYHSGSCQEIPAAWKTQKEAEAPWTSQAPPRAAEVNKPIISGLGIHRDLGACDKTHTTRPQAAASVPILPYPRWFGSCVPLDRALREKYCHLHFANKKTRAKI